MTWNPFDWTAGPFLTLYLGLGALVVLLGFVSRSRIGAATQSTDRQSTDRLSELELACLAGGPHRVGDVVLLSLLSGQGATIDTKSSKITVTDQTPLAALVKRPPLLSVKPNMTRVQFQTVAKPIVAQVQERLQERGYYPTDDQMMSFRMAALPFVALLLAFGIIKAVVGAERHHPIGFLIVLLIFTAFVGLTLAKRPLRTRAGKAVLQAYQASHARASRAPLDDELLLAVALTGAVVLSGTQYAPVYAASQTMSSDGGGGDGGSCGGGGGGGCGGCS